MKIMNSQQPNILLIMTDQQRADTLRALGNHQIQTPNLDRLVHEGIVFSNTFSPSPVCVPARASMYYGQYPAKTNCVSNSDPMPDESCPSFMQQLTDGGYRTHGVGKCHFTPDRSAMRGFETRLKQEERPKRIEDDDYLQFLQDSPYSHLREAHGVWGEMVYMPQTSLVDEQHHPSQWVGDQTIDFIQSVGQDATNKPWALFCSFIHPHPPYSPPAPWDQMYDVDSLADPYQPENYVQRQPACIKAQLHHYYFDPPTNPLLWRTVKARYYACISFVDHQVGRILEALEQSNQLDNTMILFCSDHGEMLGDLGLLGKHNMYNAAVKVPLVVRTHDGSGAGRRVDVPVSLVDIAPTLCDWAGLSPSEQYDGTSLLRIAREPQAYADRIVWSQIFRDGRGMYMAANDQLKYIHSAADHSEQLFAHVDDPHEDHNLIEVPAYRQVRDQLRNSLFDYLQKNGFADVLDTSAKQWRDWPTESIKMGRWGAGPVRGITRK